MGCDGKFRTGTESGKETGCKSVRLPVEDALGRLAMSLHARRRNVFVVSHSRAWSSELRITVAEFGLPSKRQCGQRGILPFFQMP